MENEDLTLESFFAPFWRLDRQPTVLASRSGDWTDSQQRWEAFLSPEKVANRVGKDFWRPESLPTVLARISGTWKGRQTVWQTVLAAGQKIKIEK
jgi:hypothetical protein